MSDDGNEVENGMMIKMSRLSMEDDGWEVYAADGEFNDDKGGKEIPIGSDRGTSWFSLPSSPQLQGRRIRSPHDSYIEDQESKEYASENDHHENKGYRYRRRGSSMLRQRGLERAWETKKNKAIEDETTENNAVVSGESECLVGTESLPIPIQRNRSMDMDMDEIKACRDLGFDLQSEWMLEIPTTMSGSTVDTDSGGNSPISSWKISSAGDDPRDVKARLKVWAQAVALASSPRLNG